jgi:hypothetical protein
VILYQIFRLSAARSFENEALQKKASHLGDDSLNTVIDLLNAVSIALIERYQRTLRAAGTLGGCASCLT